MKSSGIETNRITFDDVVKGKIEMPENDEDFVIAKTNGIPTYHFAHAVDDHLMRTTHVIRGDEWIASVPKHLQLFRMLGFKPPKYAHIAPIMKEENGKKRKLSKRRDPEAAVSFYFEQGYPRESILEYFKTISNSNFEEWRKQNKNEPIENFPFSLKKMSVSGALFDLAKLNDVSKNVISLFSVETVLSYILDWTKEFDPEFHGLLSKDLNYATAIFAIDRGTKNPRKDIAKWNEARDYSSFFYDELYTPSYTLPDNIAPEDAKNIVMKYRDVFDANDDKNDWFLKIKGICEPCGFCPDVKEYKQNPDAYKGHVGDVSGIIRIAVTDRMNTPDLYEIMRLLGKDRVKIRLDNFINML